MRKCAAARTPEKAANDGGVGLPVHLECLDDARIRHLIQLLGRQVAINKPLAAKHLGEPLAKCPLVISMWIPSRADFPQLWPQCGVCGTVKQGVSMVRGDHDLSAAEFHHKVLPDLAKARNDRCCEVAVRLC